MDFIYYVFWVCVGVVFYSYLGYGILLFVLTGAKRLFRSFLGGSGDDTDAKEFLPRVTMVIAAYNEEKVIKEKIANCMSLNYPCDKIDFLFVTDGSTDGTADILAGCPQVRLLHQVERRGKTAALNRAMDYVNTPITVFCDANSILNRSAIRRLVSHYQKLMTGGVSGEKRVLSGDRSGASVVGEGLYWKYESLLKRLDAQLYTVTGAAGELFSIRTCLWEPLPEDVILDDFIISTRINLQGYRIAYEPSAYSLESPSISMNEEKKRKIRISAGAFQAMVLIKEIFKVTKYPILFFQFFSHRFLRWTLTPLCFPILLILNVLIVFSGSSVFFEVSLFAQVLFYLLALAGNYLEVGFVKPGLIKICHYVFFMNYSIFLGFIKFIQGKQSAVWEKSIREEFSSAS